MALKISIFSCFEMLCQTGLSQKETIIAVAKSQKASTSREISRFAIKIFRQIVCAEHLVEKGCESLIVNCSVSEKNLGLLCLDAKN